MRIGIISDTHGRLRPEVAERLRGVDCILHAGDFDTPEVMTALERVAPVYGVRGNNDWGSWTRDLPRIMRFTMGGVSFCMAHDRNSIPWDLKGVDVVIFGHTHHYEHEQVKGRLWLNPGSCGPRRFRLPVTMAVLEVEESGVWQIKKINLAEDTENRPVCGVTEGSLKATVEIILREMRAGRKVDWIAEKLGVECAFVEQVCRIYVTHPGVDAQGIVDKMEVSALFERPKEF